MILKTGRLVLTEFTIKDASFFFELVNDPAWIQFIGDRNVKTIQDAEKYLRNKIIPSYHKNSFGFYLVSTKKDNTSIGMSGLINRDGLEHIDVGYAFLPKYWGKGYAFEATKAVLDYAKDVLNINPIVAITDIDNIKSIQLLERLGLQFDKIIQISGEPKNCRLFITL